MGKTALQIVQSACYGANLAAPSALVGSTDTLALQLLELFYDTGRELQRSKFWTQLKRSYTFSLVSNRRAYQLPQDFYAALPMAYWDRSRFWELDGPLNDHAFDYRLYGIGVSQVRRAFRVWGGDMNPNSDAGQIQISPMPGASDYAARITLEYVSKSWLTPPNWVPATSYAQNTYVVSGGNIYKKTSSGSTNSLNVPPNAFYGYGRDGGVTWLSISVSAWGGTTLYAPGDYRTNGGNLYICTVGGTSASSGGPTGTTASTDITDGTVTWRYLATAAWAGETSYATGAVATSAGAYYLCVDSGISGKTVPNFDSAATIENTTITWTFQPAAYDSLVSDADLCRFDDEIMIQGVKWRLLRARGLQYTDIKAEYDEAIDAAEARWNSGKVLDLAGYARARRFGPTVPEGNFG